MKRIVCGAILLLSIMQVWAWKTPAEVQSAAAAMENSPGKVDLYMDASRDLVTSHPGEAVNFAREAISLAQKIRDRDAWIAALGNLGLVFMNQENYTAAIEPLQKAINERTKTPGADGAFALPLAQDYRRLGICQEKNGNLAAAADNYRAAASAALQGRDREEIANAYNALGEVMIKQQNYPEAHKAFLRALPMARQAGLRQFGLTIEKNIAAVTALLEKSQEMQNYQAEIENTEQEVSLIRDSLSRIEENRQILVSEKELLQMEKTAKESELETQRAELQAKEAELKIQEAQTQNYILIGAGIGVLGVVIIIALFFRGKAISRHRKELAAEIKKVDSLLLNIFPREIAETLKQNQPVAPRRHDSVTILFTDFKGFTAIATAMAPEALVEKLGFAFKTFDAIIEKYGLEKIKTIGDAYMAAANLTRPDPLHAVHTVAAALEMQEFMDTWIGKQRRRVEEVWELRIGIHTGPVVAGIIGEKRFSYDIWGDAVNLASRMESYGEPGKVNISAATYEMAKDAFHFEPRRTVPVKNLGDVDMYFVKDLAIELHPASGAKTK
ncbi:MAG: adenylate/guanylate cyclase domain-containing protein [Bacteroidia bacterium]|nr:adenylate/guanylate cyclase domain-containing protein [Bacteroidia bacterium]